MIRFHRFSDKELKTLLGSIVILADSREQKNSHIINWLNSKNVPHETIKLDFGDYSMKIPANPELGIPRDLYFDREIAIERKNSLEELSTTFSTRDRFENELTRARGSRFILMVEETQGYEKIIEHKYSTQYNEKAFLATLFSFGHRYDMDINFIDKKYSGLFIFQQLYYFARNYLLDRQ